MPKRARLIVNAIPATYIHTGIARYLRCLYAELEQSYRKNLEIHYFDGQRLSRRMPQGPTNPGRWSKMADLFWKLPTYPALVIRLLFHYKAEFAFSRASKDFNLYHEAGYFPFKASSSLKKILTFHDFSLFRFPRHHPKERVLYTKLFLQRRCRLVNHVLAVSDFTKKEMQTYLAPVDIPSTVIPLAHDQNLFYPRALETVQAYRSRKKLPDPYFLFVGSGDPRKNMDIIPAALKHAGLEIPLVVSGWSGWSTNNCQNNVIAAGYVADEELASLYSGALALVFPSTYEGFGLPILEAMACGCPVVTTREASLPEVAGNAARYMENPTSAEELGTILLELAKKSECRDEMRREGLNRAQQFSWKRTAEKTMKVFRELL